MVKRDKAARRQGGQKLQGGMAASRRVAVGRAAEPGRVACWASRHLLPAYRLAALSLFLAACGDDGSRPTTVITLRDSADQVLEGFRHLVTSNGLRSGDIEADTAYFFDAGQATLLAKMKVNFFDSTGLQTGTLTAKRGKYYWQTGNLDAEGDVVMVSKDGRILKSPRLMLDNQAKKLSSDTVFTYDSGQNHILGDAFTSDLKFENIEAVKPRGVAGGPVLLPGQ